MDPIGWAAIAVLVIFYWPVLLQFGCNRQVIPFANASLQSFVGSVGKSLG